MKQNILAVLKIVAGIKMVPFTKSDYDGWDVSESGPHEIGTDDEWTVIRDGNLIEVHPNDESKEAFRLEMSELNTESFPNNG